MNEIARSLNRPPMYPCKYFGTELGAQTKHEPKNDRYIVNGAHDPARLQELLTGFIEKFVLCGPCGNPETDLVCSQIYILVQFAAFSMQVGLTLVSSYRNIEN
jgi:translation initiation factor 5